MVLQGSTLWESRPSPGLNVGPDSGQLEFEPFALQTRSACSLCEFFGVEMNLLEEPIDLRDFRRVYFDTSAWDYLSKHGDGEWIADLIKRSRTLVFVSVISVGEVLRDPDSARRRRTCGIMRGLHGDGHLLERPLDLALAAAHAFLRGEKEMTLPRSGFGEALHSYMHNPMSPPNEDIVFWLHNMDNNVDRFIEQIKPIQPDLATRYCIPEVLKRADFLRILCELPSTKPLNLSNSQMGELCETCDIWRSLAATLAYIVELSTRHTPKSPHRKKRTGGPDVWQLVYLGVADVFVTGDSNQLQAARSVSRCLKFPRCVVSREEFIDAIESWGLESAASQETSAKNCPICRCRLSTRVGVHATT